MPMVLSKEIDFKERRITRDEERYFTIIKLYNRQI